MFACSDFFIFAIEIEPILDGVGSESTSESFPSQINYFTPIITWITTDQVNRKINGINTVADHQALNTQGSKITNIQHCNASEKTSLVS